MEHGDPSSDIATDGGDGPADSAVAPDETTTVDPSVEDASTTVDIDPNAMTVKPPVTPAGAPPAVTGSHPVIATPEVEQVHAPPPRELPGQPLPPSVGATGPLIIPTTTVPAGPEDDDGRSARLILQGTIVVLAAGVVGLLVFAGLRAALNSPTSTDEDDGELASPTTLVPGPGDPALVAERSRSDEGPAQFDRDGDRSDPTVLSESGGETTTSRSTGTTASSVTTVSTVPSTVPTISTVTTDTTTPTTPTSLPTTPTSTPSTPTTPTTTPTTPSTPTTVPSTPTTPTTTPTTVPAFVILAPAEASRPGWEKGILFKAQTQANADRYCWRLEGLTVRTVCRSEPTYELPASSDSPGPGPVDVIATVMGAQGQALASDSISIWIVARAIVRFPAINSDHATDERLRLTSELVPGASSYCWTLTQGTLSSGEFCGAARNVFVDEDSPLRAGFGPGAATARLRILGGPTDKVLLGNQTVGFTFVDPDAEEVENDDADDQDPEPTDP